MEPAQKSASAPVRKPSRALARERRGRAHALELIHAVCCLAGSPSLIDDFRNELVDAGILDAIKTHDTPKLFDWIVRAFGYQGIADAIASDYMDRHGVLTWAGIAADLNTKPSCPKLQSYWHFHDCGYRKIAGASTSPTISPPVPCRCTPCAMAA